MPEWVIETVEDESPDDAAVLRDRLLAFNFATTGYRDGRPLQAFVRDDAGALVGGVDGFTWGGYARVEYLWVAEQSRGRGLGRALMSAAIEEARRRGCATMVLQSHTFQAPGFYEGLGFTEVGRTIGTPAGHDEVLLQLDLGRG